MRSMFSNKNLGGGRERERDQSLQLICHGHIFDNTSDHHPHVNIMGRNGNESFDRLNSIGPVE